MAGPGGVEVGRASVRVLPDTSKFRQSLEKYLERTERSLRVQVPLDVDQGAFNSRVSAAVQAAQAAAPEIDVDVDVDKSTAVDQTREAVKNAERAAPKISAELKLNVARFIAAARAAAKAAGTGLKVTARLTLNSKPFLAALAAAKIASDFFGGSIMRNAVTALPAMVGSLGVATVAVAGLAGPLAAVGAQAMAAAGSMLTLGGGLAVAGIATAALMIGTLKAAFSGMGDAINAESAEDFAAATENMAPAAREAAGTLRELKGEFKGLGTEVQGTFFANMSNLGGLSALVEPLRANMVGLASDMGNATAGLVAFVSEGVGLSAFKTMLHGASDAGANLSYVFADILQGLIAVGAAAAPILGELTESLSNWSADWAARMTEGFQDGSLQETFRGGLEAARGFGDFMGTLGGIISGVFGAMSAAGQPFLGTLGQALEATNEWVNSLQGQEALTSFFSSMSSAVATVLPIFGQLASIIGTTVAPAIAGFIEAIGPGLSAAVDGLGTGLAAIAPAMAPLGEAFGQILEAAAPLLPVIGEIIGALGSALAPVIGALAPLVSMIAGVFQTLSPVLATVAGIIGTVLTTALQALTPWWDVLGQAVAMLAPYLQQIAQIFGGLLMTALSIITPLIPVIAAAFMQILQAIMPLLPIVIQLAGTLISALVPVLASLIPAIVAVIGVVANIISALAPLVAIILQVVAAFVGLLGTVLGFVASALGAIISFVAGVIGAFVGMVASVVATVAGWVASVVGFVNSLVQTFLSKVSELWGNVISAFSSGVSNALQFVADMPGRARAALGNVGSVLVDSGKALIRGFIDGIKSMIGAVADAARGAVQAARDFFPFSPAKKGPFSGRGWVLHSGRSLGSAFAKGIQDTTPDAARATAGLMSAASSNLSGYQAGVRYAGTGPLATSMAALGGGRAGAGTDASVHIGQLVAADMSAPLREVRSMQRKAQIKAGQV